MKSICFIGAGKMATAIASGLHKSAGKIAICAYDPSAEAAKLFTERCGGSVLGTPAAALKKAEVVLIAVKPQYLASAMTEIRGKLAGKPVISIVAGATLATLEKLSGTDRLVRVMPNTPALVGEGMACLAPGKGAKPEDLACAEQIFKTVGRVRTVPESQLDAVTGLSGSAPAFVLEFIMGLADGGVYSGLPRAAALELAAQTVLGSAKLMLATGRHPAELRDDVVSPGGTTARGVMALQEGAFRAVTAKAVIRAAERSAELGALAAKK